MLDEQQLNGLYTQEDPGDKYLDGKQMPKPKGAPVDPGDIYLSGRGNSRSYSPLSNVNLSTPDISKFLGDRGVPSPENTGQDIGLMLGESQSFGNKLARRAANLVPNVAASILDMIGSVGSLLTEWGDERDYHNAMNDIADSIKDPAGQSYARSNDTWDLASPTWWLNNVADLTEFAGGFALGGAGAGMLLGKAVGAINSGSKLLAAAGELGTSALVSYAEAAQAGTQVYKEVYDNQFQKLIAKGLDPQQAADEAKHIAAQSAATTAQLGTLLTMGINTGAYASFFKSPANNARDIIAKRIAQSTGSGAEIAGVIRGMNAADYMDKLLHHSTVRAKVGQMFKEGNEELLQQFAQQTGTDIGNKGQTKDFISQFGEIEHLIDRTANSQGLLSFVMGAGFGGLQNVLLHNIIPSKRVNTMEGDTEVQRMNSDEPVTDANGIPRMQKRWVTPRTAERDFTKRKFDTLKDSLAYDFENFDRINNDILKAVAKGDEIAAEQARNELFDSGRLHAIKQGLTEPWKKTFTKIAEMEPEQAMEAGYINDESDLSYKDKASQAIADMDHLTDVYGKLNKRFGGNEANQPYIDMLFARHADIYSTGEILKKYEKQIIANEKEAAELAELTDAEGFSKALNDHFTQRKSALVVEQQLIADHDTLLNGTTKDVERLLRKYRAVGYGDGDTAEAVKILDAKLKAKQEEVLGKVQATEDMLLHSNDFLLWQEKNPAGKFDDFMKEVVKRNQMSAEIMSMRDQLETAKTVHNIAKENLQEMTSDKSISKFSKKAAEWEDQMRVEAERAEEMRQAKLAEMVKDKQTLGRLDKMELNSLSEKYRNLRDTIYQNINTNNKELVKVKAELATISATDPLRVWGLRKQIRRLNKFNEQLDAQGKKFDSLYKEYQVDTSIDETPVDEEDITGEQNGKITESAVELPSTGTGSNPPLVVDLVSEINNRKRDNLTHKERKRILLEAKSDGLTLDEAYEKAGYTKIGEIWVSPDISDAKLSMISDTLWKAMEDAGIGVLSFTNAESVHGVAREQEFDDRTTSEIQLSSHELEQKGLVHVIAHEIGHAVYRTLSEEQKQSFKEFVPVSNYVEALKTGALTSGASTAEENFVENFAADLTNRLFGNSRFAVQEQYKELLDSINSKYNTQTELDLEGDEDLTTDPIQIYTLLYKALPSTIKGQLTKLVNGLMDGTKTPSLDFFNAQIAKGKLTQEQGIQLVQAADDYVKAIKDLQAADVIDDYEEAQGPEPDIQKDEVDVSGIGEPDTPEIDNTDEDIEVPESTGYHAGYKIIPAASTGATSTIGYTEGVRTGKKGEIVYFKITDPKALNKELNEDILRSNWGLPGHPLRYEIDTEYDGQKLITDSLSWDSSGDVKRDAEKGTDYLDANGKVLTGEKNIGNVPIRVMDGVTGKFLFHIRKLDWLEAKFPGTKDYRNVVDIIYQEDGPPIDNFAIQRAELLLIRQAIVDKFNTEGKATEGQIDIHGKGTGRLILNYVTTGSGTSLKGKVEKGFAYNKSAPEKSLLPDPGLTLVIADTGNVLNSGLKYPFTGDLGFDKMQVPKGAVGAMVPAANGQFMYAPLIGMKVVEGDKPSPGLNSIVRAIELFLLDDGTDPTIGAEINNIESNTGFNVATARGLKAFINQYYTYSQNFPDSALSPNAKGEKKERFLFNIDAETDILDKTKQIKAGFSMRGQPVQYANLVAGSLSPEFVGMLRNGLQTRSRAINYTDSNLGIKGINSLGTFTDATYMPGKGWKHEQYKNYNEYVKSFSRTPVYGRNQLSDGSYVYTANPQLPISTRALNTETEVITVPNKSATEVNIGEVDIEAKKTDIEKRRQEELINRFTNKTQGGYRGFNIIYKGKKESAIWDKRNKVIEIGGGQGGNIISARKAALEIIKFKTEQDGIDYLFEYIDPETIDYNAVTKEKTTISEVNAKYDAELAALEVPPADTNLLDDWFNQSPSRHFVPAIGTGSDNSTELTMASLEKIYNFTPEGQRNGKTVKEVFTNLKGRGHTYLSEGFNPFSRCL